MDGGIQTSFIPKQESFVKQSPKQVAPMGLFVIVSSIILAISLVFFAGAYAYKTIIYNEINSACGQANSSGDQKCGLLSSVQIERQNLNPDRLMAYRRLDAKMKIAKDIIEKHNTFIPFFNVLATSTLKTVRYTKFEYNDKNGINLSGIASSYEDIAVQSKVFNQIKQIKSFMFSDLDLNDKGYVNFKLVLTLDPSIVSYKLYSDALMPIVAEPAQALVATSTGDTISTSSNATSTQ
ncbi:MAG: hypothetical protein WCO03_00205 [bacterium]